MPIVTFQKNPDFHLSPPSRPIRDYLRYVLHRALVLWKWCLSFRKADWSLRDYPVIIKKNEADGANIPSRFKPIPYSALILNWCVVSGGGDTASEALADLERNFDSAIAERLSNQERPPRPGLLVPLEFVASDRVDAHRELAADFIERVLDLEKVWISDESSLWDFHSGETNDELVAKIRDIYSVDVSDIESAKLCEIFERIAQDRRLRE